MSSRATGPPLAVLRRITATRAPRVEGERCEMCAQPIRAEHQHVVNVQSRQLLCTCRGCYLLFTDQGAELRYRSVPERYLSFPNFSMGPGQWDELEIPVGLAFFFCNSELARTVAFYPGPAGATESELPLGAWDKIAAVNPEMATLAPDVEALLIRAPGGQASGGRVSTVSDCHLVPIDACYELVGQLRKLWRGFDGGQDAHAQIVDFFASVEKRSRPAPPVGGGLR